MIKIGCGIHFHLLANKRVVKGWWNHLFCPSMNYLHISKFKHLDTYYAQIGGPHLLSLLLIINSSLPKLWFAMNLKNVSIAHNELGRIHS